ncbi:hypothetical protein MVES1_003918 [Malassezia vespertilionis]|uniref:Uncharacterized protein n=1 Tax=Malassezia vespertilionis TaxID=2020962 RepID=A0A2N1J7V4_9BASI|nr:uncharacterized protein MVES1_003918 [Malassezia vespertilionis]PKI82638.1 hypothetical protein MVES_003473 [Malassezia vespertilionis]WFD08542.1 hypothetical protein MVES1_003918 [Malassezia vespertilionis]
MAAALWRVSMPGSKKRAWGEALLSDSERWKLWVSAEDEHADSSEDGDEDAQLGTRQRLHERVAKGASSPSRIVPAYKRRHIDGVMDGNMEMMSLEEKKWQDPEVCDAEMSQGSSYDISPHRTFVSSLDDLEEEDGPSYTQSGYQVNPCVLAQLGDTPKEPTCVPKWLATAQDQSILASPEKMRSLVLYQPPIHAVAQSSRAIDPPDALMTDL